MRSIAQWFDAAENFRLHVCSLNSLHKDWLIDIVFQAAAETCFLAPYNGLGAPVPREGPIMAQNKKRLGKKHRQASTRPKKGRAPRTTPTTGAVDPRKRKILS